MSTSGTGGDSGFLVPADISKTIFDAVTGEDSLLGMTSMIKATKDRVIVPGDKTTP